MAASMHGACNDGRHDDDARLMSNRRRAPPRRAHLGGDVLNLIKSIDTGETCLK
jgi:hypothetical protein